MNYFIKGPVLKPDITFTDTTLLVGKKIYQYSDMKGIRIVSSPTIASNGVAEFVVNGKNVMIAYSKKDENTMNEAVNAVNKIIEDNIDKQTFELRTAEDLYLYCEKMGFGKSVIKSMGIKNFQLILDALMSDEKILFAFFGLHNYEKNNKDDGTYAYAVTNKRIIYAQKKAVGESVKSVSLDTINDITKDTGSLNGIITIDTAKEKFKVGVSSIEADNIYKKLQKVLELLKSLQQNTVSINVSNEKSAVDKIKELKELLDMGILTEEEFNLKKKQLLGL